MPFRSQIHKDRLHHAYIIEGAHIDCVPKLLSFVETELAMPIVGNPNIWREHFEAFGIDEGRKLKEMQSLRPASGDKKIFILSVNSITREAQNALLKVLEEPTVGTHFFFVLPTVSMLLPTIFSRVVLIQTHESRVKGETTEADILAKQFSESAIAERLKIAKTLSESEDRGMPRDFVNALERYWYDKVGSKSLPSYQKWFALIAKCRSYLSDRSPSVKMLLEHLAVAIPKE
ncbi:MAG: hypothetical protein RLZZ347_141 [Candidatus Parcubacteria bacterium]|jgi:hypothetical protein